MNISANISDTIHSGLAVSNKLFALAEKIRPATAEVNKVAVEISLLTSTLHSLRSVRIDSEGCRYSIGATTIAQKVLDRCQDLFRELDRVLIGLKHDGVRMEDLVPKVKAEFEKTGMKILWATLEACSITFQLLLHNLSVAKKPTVRRASMYSIDVEVEQQELIIQSLRTSRQGIITILEQLEHGDPDQNSLTSTKPTNKLRKPKPPTKQSQPQESNIKKERASDWVKRLIRDERTNALIALEFSPSPRVNSEAFEDLARKNASGAEGKVGVGVGELQGDGPDDLPSSSERMEYARGWPRI
ncbi:hypothetical protein ONS95_007275 [Cadophora gregata]|uniref:uncharacterized protein n=1 Tax=Cadophora gregata TaxID=51156 RepID=UPI0026DCF6EA|nr:uncharacterized protein ONS95_007275 [Cadophora gregata]KAK0100827.1 hypothetical protein ONS95_007275 [Cadophora gregata]KAK0117179.1 hypothetical protein ONS96_013012 [Cadophora gregata f. sp. sojae]